MKRYLHNKLLYAAFAVLLTGMAGIFMSGSRLVHYQDLYEISTTLKMTQQRLFIGLLEAETGQRGYVITGDSSYLEPYSAGGLIVPNALALYARQSLNEDQKAFLDDVRPLIAEKLAELDRTVSLRREQGFEAAISVIRANSGRNAMDKLRRMFALEHERINVERDTLEHRVSMMTQSTLYSVFIAFCGLLLIRYAVMREKR